MKTAANNPVMPGARAFLEASPVEEEAVVLLLAVDVDGDGEVEVEVEVPDGLVTVVVVDPVRVPEDEGEEGEFDPVEVTPGPETDVSPGEGVAAPEVATSAVPVCPLHVAFPAESLPQVSPAGQQKLKSPPHSTRAESAQPENPSQFWPVWQHPVTPLMVVQVFPVSQHPSVPQHVPLFSQHEAPQQLPPVQHMTT